MASRAIGIDLGARCVRAVQLVRAGQGVALEGAHEQAIPSPAGREELVGALRVLVRDGGLRRRAPAAAAMPPGSVLFQSLETDLAGLDQVRRVLAFELEDDLALDVERAVIDVCAARQHEGGGQVVLAGAVTRDALDERVEAVEAAGLRCRTVDAEVCAMHAAVAHARGDAGRAPFAFGYVRAGHVSIGLADEAGLLRARSAPRDLPDGADPWSPAAMEELAAWLAGELQMTWRAACGPAPARAELWLAGESDRLYELADLLAAQGFAARVLEPFEGMDDAGGQAAAPQFAIAAGLALRGLGRAPGGLNLLAAGELETVQAAATRRGVMLLVVLLCLTAAVWTAGLFLRLHRLEEENARVEAQMREVFTRTLPDERYVGQPVAQLEARLEELRAEYDAFASVGGEVWSPLHVLRRLSEGTPPALSVKVVELFIGGRTVRLKGYTDSFRSVEDLEAALEALPEFASVELQDTDLRAGQLMFTLAMTLAPR